MYPCSSELRENFMCGTELSTLLGIGPKMVDIGGSENSNLGSKFDLKHTGFRVRSLVVIC